MAEEWRKAGVVIGQFNAEANLAFNGERYADAARWYERGALFDPEPSPENIFRWTVASIASHNALPDMPFAVPDLAIHPLTDTFSINGDELSWIHSNPAYGLQYGDPLSKFPTGAPNVGVLWWAGRAAFFIDVPEQSAYHIHMRVMGRVTEGQNVPLEIQLERDFFPVEKYILSDATQKWMELEAATVFPPGLHIISIRFLKDNGDIFIHWVRLEKAAGGT
jgi:hypothetical protein